MQEKQKAIIIGSGVAGLAAAIRLSVQGFNVTVYEKNDIPGGKITAFSKNGFLFDAGPSLFTRPQNINELFELAGEPIEDHFKYKSIPVACSYFYENGVRVSAFTDGAKLADELKDKLGESVEAVEKYLSQSKKLYEDVGQIFLSNSLHKRNTWINKKIIRALLTVKYRHIFKSLHSFNLSEFKTAETIQLFDRFATYNGSNPYKAPGMLSLIPHIELNGGVFYPEKGMISITNALFKLAQKTGVKFVFNAEVQKIIHTEGCIKGIVYDNKNILADKVICNVDVYFAYKNLLSNNLKSAKILKQERSSSALVFYWGIKKEFKELGLHNILFSKDYKEEFNCLFNRKTVFDDPTVYINITSKMEPGNAPENMENWFVMVNAPTNCGQDWAEIIHKTKQAVIEKINRILQTDIESYIDVEEILDPIQIEQATNSFMGSLYGTSSNGKMAAFLRHPNFSKSIKGLYFCGGSVHPGGGIPLCLQGAKIVSELIQTEKY